MSLATTEVQDGRPTLPVPDLDSIPGGLFAKLLLKEGMIDGHALAKARRVQARLGNDRLLSAVLLDMNLISKDDHRRIVRKYGHTFRFGELQCELGNITLEQLHEAEAAIKRWPGKRMGEILIDLGYIDDRKLAQALSDQLSLPLLHVEPEMVDVELLTQFPMTFLRKNLVIPFDASEKSVSLLMADPLNKPVIEKIEKQLQKKAVVHVGVRSNIDSLINRLVRGLQVEGGRDNAIGVVESLLHAAIRTRASDIHIEPMSDHVRVRLRLDGVLVHHVDLPRDLAQRVISSIKVMADLDIADQRRHQDGRVSRKIGDINVDFRVSTYVTLYGENLVMRVLRRDGGMKSLGQIGMSRGLLNRFRHDALDVPTGVVIITGPTGSGKTTTMYAAIDYLNHPSVKIITAEDPVEYAIDGIMQCAVDNKVGRTFHDSLKAIVRQDPDIIVLGEIRDRASAEVAVQAALTGHKVLTTFHTEDSIGGLLRLIDMGIETFLISSTVISVLAQRLVRCICPDCRQPYLPDLRIAKILGLDRTALNNYTFYRGIGCATCHGTGYYGRTSLHELLVLNEEVRNAILEKRSSYEVRRISCETTDLLSLMECGLFKVFKGLTTVEEVYRIAPRSMSMRSINEIARIMGESL